MSVNFPAIKTKTAKFDDLSVMPVSCRVSGGGAVPALSAKYLAEGMSGITKAGLLYTTVAAAEARSVDIGGR
ncbi:MAG: hypothetical protein K2H30_06050, partial [Clostridia bacterium]|nr:hypothetical protein [Clostridia bacterium]